jgi:hypothetical protein
MACAFRSIVFGTRNSEQPPIVITTFLVSALDEPQKR